MKILIVSLYSQVDKIEKIMIELIHKEKGKYNLKTLHVEHINYKEEDLNTLIEKIIFEIKKFNLINTKIVVRYHNDGISYFNLTLPKKLSKNSLENVNSEMNKLVPNFNSFFNSEIIKISSKKELKFRVILYPKMNFKNSFANYKLYLLKPVKVKTVFDYEICEKISKNFILEKESNIGFVYMINDEVSFYVINNGFVIENYEFDLNIKYLKKYKESHEPKQIMKYNDDYFRHICLIIEKFMRQRNVFSIVFFFSESYNEYLQKLIINNIKINSQIVDYKNYYWKVLNEILSEK